MRRFFTCNILLVTVVTTALACGPWVRPIYYMFSVYNRNQMGETYTKGLLNYWGQYSVGQTLTPYDIENLTWVSSDEFDTSENVLIESARSKQDTEMLDYLRLLCTYLQVSNDARGDAWSYPTKQELQQRGTRMDYIFNRARSYTGTRLLPQYELLALRALMLKGDYATIIKRWQMRGNKLPESVFKNMAQGIYANALLNTGKRQEACEIYAALGDMRSIKWVMRDKRNLNGIKEEYRANPNSPTLVFLVQDFVNNMQSTLDALREGERSIALGYTYDGFEAELSKMRESAQAMRDFIPFAQQVIKDKKTQVPALWMSAAGQIEALSGNHKEGIAMLDKAMKMKGTQRMLDNARVCRLMATVPTAQATTQYKEYLLGELQWLSAREETEFEESFEYGNTDNHYSEMLQNLCYDYLYPHFTAIGESSLATALVGWCDAHETNLYDGYDVESSSDYFHAVDSLTSKQMIAYTHLLNNPSGKLEHFLVETIKPTLDDYETADKIGTKLLREGQFAEAISWLKQVVPDYYSGQRISAYMAHRTYKKQQWFELQRGVERDSEYARISENQKLSFAHDMVEAIKRVNNTTGIEQARAKYDLAAMYFEASYKGNCWYLTRYFSSVYDDGPAYAEEKDFVAEAVRLLQEAADQSAGNFDVCQRCLYANAYIPFGKPYVTIEYDNDFNPVEHRDPTSHEYLSHRQLAQFYQANRSRVASYISRCDILKRFM